jgi:chromate transporter
LNASLLLQIARVFAVLSLASIGGANAILPEIRRQAVDVQGWMNDAAFTQVFAISHVAPGPNIIMVSLIGWRVAGLAGLVVATIAIMAPSCALAFLVARGMARWSESHWIALIKEGLIPVALGLILASGVAMMRTTDRNVLTLAISLMTTAFVVLTRRNPLWAVAAGTVLSLLAIRFGLLR